MFERLAYVVRTESSVVRPDAPVLAVVSARWWAPRWLVFRVARAWFTLDPGTPRVMARRTEPQGRAEWHIAWSREDTTT